jgi:hypothetical protein
MLKVAAITGGKDVPSARFRVRQFIPALLECDVFITELNSHTNAYPPINNWARPAWAAMRMTEIFSMALRSHQYDVTLLQREMMSTFVTLEKWTSKPRVLDVDDAIHLFRNGEMAKKLATYSDRVICGNHNLAEIYKQWNSDVAVLPTAVDTDRFCPSSSGADNESVTIGWI